MNTSIHRRFAILVSVAAAAVVIGLHPQAVAGLTGASGASDNGGAAHAPAGGGAGHGK